MIADSSTASPVGIPHIARTIVAARHCIPSAIHSWPVFTLTEARGMNRPNGYTARTALATLTNVEGGGLKAHTISSYCYASYMFIVDPKPDELFSAFFRDGFVALTGSEPFRWQSKLAEAFLAAAAPGGCDIPTGLGKTAIIPIWLIALAFQARSGVVALPRRLVYVVDRRTVVDQATDVAKEIHRRLARPESAEVAEGLARLSADRKKLLSISTLRGELADNGEWREDPGRAAIIVGTIDMIGSRLLFSGYGVSRGMRPIHAGLLGQDTLIVHDEAHLSPAFGCLIRDIERIQQQHRGNSRPIRVTELSATRRTGSSADSRVFELKDDERSDPIIQRRLTARKSLSLSVDGPVDDGGLEQWLVETALGRERERAAARDRIVVFVRSPEMAKKVADRLAKEIGDRQRKRVAVLTGTIRGHERDKLANSPLFRGFRADPDRLAPDAAEYLVATSAGEVGIDLDADHMVSDLTTLDSMIQRLGRVNRLGHGDAQIDVIVAPSSKKEADADQEARLAATREALLSLAVGDDGRHDASPLALENLIKRLGSDGVERCFSKTPRMVALTDVLLDNWAMTSIDKLPGRPPVDRWLRGITSEPPSVYLAWRAETDEVVKANPADFNPADLKKLFDAYPIRARERLGAPLRDDTIAELRKIAKRLGERTVVILGPRGEASTASLSEAITEKEELAEATIVLPLDAGGLDAHGMLDGGEARPVDDVADIEAGGSPKNGEAGDDRPQRVRVLLMRDPDTNAWSARILGGDGATLPSDKPASTYREAIRQARKELPLEGPVELARIVLETDKEGGDETRALLLYARSGTIEAAEGSQDVRGKVLLTDHNRDVAVEAERIAARVLSRDGEAGLAGAIAAAGARHDDGKDRDGWQKAIGNSPPRGDRSGWKALAKSDDKGFDESACGKYRHEFGSLRTVADDPSVRDDPEADLILHLIAAHHGWARPHFRPEQEDIGDTAYGENEAVAAETLRRFASLQRRFGHWGLAFLETLLRTADHRVSAGIAKAAEPSEGEQ